MQSAVEELNKVGSGGALLLDHQVSLLFGFQHVLRDLLPGNAVGSAHFGYFPVEHGGIIYDSSSWIEWARRWGLLKSVTAVAG